MKLQTEKKYIEVADKAIASTKTKLAALIKAKADNKTIEKVKTLLAAEEKKEIETKKYAE